MATEIYDNGRRLAVATQLLLRSPSISAQAKQDAVAFTDDCIAAGFSTGRIARYVFDARKLLEWSGGDLRGLTLAQAKALVVRIEQSDYAPATKRDLKITLRKFVHFQSGLADLPPAVAWIRPSAGMKSRPKLPEEILTPDEVTRVIQAARTVRDQAFIATLYESGCRIGEMLPLRIRHVAPADPGLILRVDGKTGPRRLRVISSAPYLTQYLNLHPQAGNTDARLWLSHPGAPWSYTAMSQTLRATALQVGIRKHIYPHLFRHSRATHLASHLTEAQTKEYFGWTQSSEMAAVYVHMSGRDVDHAILRLHGLEPPKADTEKHLTPVACPRCRAINPATHRYCMVCGTPVDEKAAARVVAEDLDRKDADAILDQLTEDAEFREFLAKKIKRLQPRP